jgi:hypothetical protein
MSVHLVGFYYENNITMHGPVHIKFELNYS